MKLSKLRTEKIHPVLKLAKLEYSILPNSGLQRIASFLRSPIAEEINKYKKVFDKNLSVRKLPDVSIDDIVTRKTKKMLTKNLKNKNYRQIQEHLYKFNRGLESIQQTMTRSTSTRNNTFCRLHRSYGRLKVYNRKNYNKKKALMILQNNWLLNKSNANYSVSGVGGIINKIDINDEITNRIQQHIKNIASCITRWQDLFLVPYNGVSIFERDISSPIIRNLRRNMNYVTKESVDRVLINYCKQLYSIYQTDNSIYTNNIKRLILSSYSKYCLDIDIKKKVENTGNFVRVHRGLKKNELLEYAIKINPDKPMSEFKPLKKSRLKELVVKKLPDLFDFEVTTKYLPYYLNPKQNTFSCYYMSSSLILLSVIKKDLPSVKNCTIEYVFNRNKYNDIVSKYTNYNFVRSGLPPLTDNDINNINNIKLNEKYTNSNKFIVSRYFHNIIDDNIFTVKRLNEYCEKQINKECNPGKSIKLIMPVTRKCSKKRKSVRKYKLVVNNEPVNENIMVNEYIN